MKIRFGHCWIIPNTKENDYQLNCIEKRQQCGNVTWMPICLFLSPCLCYFECAFPPTRSRALAWRHSYGIKAGCSQLALRTIIHCWSLPPPLELTIFASNMETQGQYCDEKLVVPPRDMNELIGELRKVFDYDRVNIDYVQALLESYKSNPKDWKKFAKFDRHRYCIFSIFYDEPLSQI